MLRPTLLTVLLMVGVPTAVYFGTLCAMVAVPSLQAHAIYLHLIALTWFNDLNVPEQFGFAPRQVTPFTLTTDHGVTLHAWHVLPLGVYRRHYEELLAEGDAKSSKGSMPEAADAPISLQLLRDDRDARLVIYMHGASGTLASGWRPDSCRTLYSAAPHKIHIVAFDYRGFGLSDGLPTEPGLQTDALAVFGWATITAGIPPEHIVIFGQSLGSAVAIALADHLAMQTPPVSCAGLVITAPFSNVANLATTYRIGGTIPVLSPIARIRPLFKYFTQQLHSTWRNDERIMSLVRNSRRFYINIIHAEDDTDIPCAHSTALFRRAVVATSATKQEVSRNAGPDERHVEAETIRGTTTDLGDGGWFTEWTTNRGTIRQDMLKYGLHDKLMSYPTVALAVLRAFQSIDPDFPQPDR